MISILGAERSPWVACLISLGLLMASVAVAQEASAPEPVTAADFASLEQRIEADTQLESAARESLQSQLQAGKVWLERAREFVQQAAEFRSAADSAPEAIARYQKQLADADASAEEGLPLPDPETPLAQLEGRLTLLEAERASLAETRARVRNRLEGMSERRGVIQERLVELQEEPGAVPATGVPQSLEQRVVRLASAARRQALAAEREALGVELETEQQRLEVASAERLWLERALADLDARIELLVEAVQKARNSATEEKLEATAELQKQVAGDDPALRELANENRRLAEQLQQTSDVTEQASENAATLQDQLEFIEEDSHLMRRRLEVAGRKEVLGRVMVTRLESLQDTRAIRRAIRVRDDRIAQTSLAIIDTEEALRQSGAGLEEWPQASLQNPAERQVLERLLEQRRQLLQNNLDGLSDLLGILVENNAQAASLITATEEYHQFLLGNLLWLRNFSFVDLELLRVQLAAMLAPSSWLEVPAALWRGYQAQPWHAVLLLALLMLVIVRRRLKPFYRHLLGKPTPLGAESLWAIVTGLSISLVMALPYPLALGGLGYFLRKGAASSVFVEALGGGLIIAAWLLWVLLLAHLIVAKRGLGRRFLKWDARRLGALRLELDWAGPVLVLGGFVQTFAYQMNLVVSGGPVAALATTLMAGALALVSWRLLRNALFDEVRSLRLALRLILVVSASVIIMQVVGLLFAAELYLRSLWRSILAVFLVVFSVDVVERWLLILRFRLQRKQREENRAFEEGVEEGVVEEATTAGPDLESLSAAHASLLSLLRLVALAIVLYLIWSPVLPALDLLEGVNLWQVVDPGDSDTILRTVTLMDVVFAAMVLVVTVLVARHLPSLVQVFMLEWLNVSPGARYASGILVQYLVLAVGLGLFLETVGWDWSSVQWLVAALGVGIGFGLQEIVANFISGVIILFERPVRVGDIITVGSAEGKVTEIKARATVIETFEKKEIMIPNKELITSQVVNWSLSAEAVRVLIPVGVAYGSDVERALALMLQAANGNPRVLQDPEPRATFDDFGDNALLLVLRCYIAEDRIGVWTELRSEINRLFEEAGIVISFPQRDVHLDTLAPLQVELRYPKDD